MISIKNIQMESKRGREENPREREGRRNSIEKRKKKGNGEGDVEQIFYLK